MTDTTPLNDIITARINERGRITFADFMAACLYEPGLGYYTSPGQKVGAEGDFYTSSNVSAHFGRIVAREIVKMDELLGSPDPFDLVEVGAYRKGADPRVDHAIAAYPKLADFVRQGLNKPSSRADALRLLGEAVGIPADPAKSEVNRG